MDRREKTPYEIEPACPPEGGPTGQAGMTQATHTGMIIMYVRFHMTIGKQL